MGGRPFLVEKLRVAAIVPRVLLTVALAAAIAVVLGGTAFAQSFRDIRADDWFAGPVEDLAAAGIVQGHLDGTFRPYDTVTRAQFTVMMDRALQPPAAEGAPFIDVRPDDWYFQAVARLYGVGLVRGMTHTSFVPDAGIAREQAASMVFRALVYRVGQEESEDETDEADAADAVPATDPDAADAVPATDPDAADDSSAKDILPAPRISLEINAAEVQAWLGTLRDRWFVAEAHKESVAQCIRLSVMTGYPDERFYPMLTLTRAQAAGIVHRALYSSVQARGEVPPAVAAEAAYPTQKIGSSGMLVSFLENRLAQLGYALIEVDDYFSESTRDAVMAFQKVERLTRDGQAGEQVWSRLAAAQRPQPRLSATGRRVEIDLTRQVLFLVDNNQVTQILNCSSGTDGWRTPTGRFSIFRKDVDWQRSPLGYLYYPAYFYGGFAIHGSRDVPGWPASHGCIRIPVWATVALWNQLFYGIRVDLYH
ncbi:MAG: L,D-transpeptidase family protein [Actinobacteria bacterium]|nr:L,D-transpeptidase family protein [Actinomycetota bacterium]